MVFPEPPGPDIQRRGLSRAALNILKSLLRAKMFVVFGFVIFATKTGGFFMSAVCRNNAHNFNAYFFARKALFPIIVEILLF